MGSTSNTSGRTPRSYPHPGFLNHWTHPHVSTHSVSDRAAMEVLEWLKCGKLSRTIESRVTVGVGRTELLCLKYIFSIQSPKSTLKEGIYFVFYNQMVLTLNGFTFVRAYVKRLCFIGEGSKVDGCDKVAEDEYTIENKDWKLR